MQPATQHLLKLGMTNDRELDALVAYLNYLKAKGANAESLLKREKVLTKLDWFISEIPSDGSSYREAVDQFLREIDKAEWPFYLTVIREYYLFWINDVKKIVQLNSQEGFEPDPQQWKAITGSLKSVWAMLDKIVLSKDQLAIMELYATSLDQNVSDEKLKATQFKLAKLLIFKLGNSKVKSPRIYRRAVDAVLPVFESAAQREVFLATARDFYYVWLSK